MNDPFARLPEVLGFNVTSVLLDRARGPRRIPDISRGALRPRALSRARQWMATPKPCGGSTTANASKPRPFRPVRGQYAVDGVRRKGLPELGAGGSVALPRARAWCSAIEASAAGYCRTTR